MTLCSTSFSVTIPTGWSFSTTTIDPTFSLVIKSITVEVVSRGETVGGAGLMFVSTDRLRTSSEYDPVSPISLAWTL
jgi:hypothetical protein